MINYDGRKFRVGGEDTADVPQATYHQDGSVLWGEFAGGHVRRGSLAGSCAPDGTVTFAYCMVYDSGEIVSGRCRSTPQRLDDGRIRLYEEWERYAPQADRGVSLLDEVAACISDAGNRPLSLAEGGSNRPSRD